MGNRGSRARVGWVSLFLLALLGCGGSGTDRHGTGRATIAIAWPVADTRYIPSLSNSIQLQVRFGATTLRSQLLVKPATTYTFNGLPVGNLTLVATAYPNSGGTGTPQALGTSTLTIVAGQTTNLTLTLASAIDHVTVTPATATLKRNGTVTVSATAYDASNNVVLVPSDWQYSSSRTAVATANATSGLVTGQTGGKVYITATEAESGKSGNATITVIGIAASYTVVDLGVGSGTASVGRGINASGVTVGYTTGGPGQRAVQWAANGTLTSLAGLTGGYSVAANCINDSNTIGGSAVDSTAKTWPVYWTGGTCTKVNMGGGTAPAEILGISPNGDLVGYNQAGADDQGIERNLALGQQWNLSKPSSTTDYRGLAANDSFIAGWKTYLGAYSPAYWQVNSGPSHGLLPTLSGGQAACTALDPANNAYGWANVTGGAWHACTWNSGGAISDLGTVTGYPNSYAYGCSPTASLVCGKLNNGTTDHAMVYMAGTMVDLNTRISGGSWVLQAANGVNDSGQLVGYGTIGGATHAFRLDPVFDGPP